MTTSITFDGSLSRLEQEALERALRGVESWKATLRSQLPKLQVVAREYTGYGFFSKFSCANCDAAPSVPSAGAASSPVAWATHPDVEGGITFSVFIVGGYIDCLEAASTTPWPESESLVQFLD